MKCNKPKRTPEHKTKSHVVKACEDGKEKIIRFGQQGVEGAGKNPKTEKEKQEETRYWSHKVKWWFSMADKFKKVMDEFKAGELKSGSGKKVTSRKQALAIALAMKGKSKK